MFSDEFVNVDVQIGKSLQTSRLPHFANCTCDIYAVGLYETVACGAFNCNKFLPYRDTLKPIYLFIYFLISKCAAMTLQHYFLSAIVCFFTLSCRSNQYYCVSRAKYVLRGSKNAHNGFHCFIRAKNQKRKK